MLIVMSSAILSILLTANRLRSLYCGNLGFFTQPILADPTAGPTVYTVRSHYTDHHSGAYCCILYNLTTVGIVVVSIHKCGNHSRMIFLLRVIITTRSCFNTVYRSPYRSQSVRMLY
jgi:hypothetical protein